MPRPGPRAPASSPTTSASTRAATGGAATSPLELRKPEPDGFTRFRSLTLAKSWSYNFDGDKQGDAVNVFGRLALPQLLETRGYGSFRSRGLDDRQTRGGPSMITGRAWNGGLWLGTDERKPVVGRVESFHFRNEWGSHQWDGEAVAEVRPSSALDHLASVPRSPRRTASRSG